MSASVSVVGDLWQMVKLLREKPNAKEEHKAVFRQLVTSLGVSPLHLESTAEGLAFQGILVQAELSGAEDLNRTMQMHGIGEIELPEGTAPGPLLSLCKALSQPKNTYVHIDAFRTTVGEPGASQFKISPPSAATSMPAGGISAVPVTTGSEPPRQSTQLPRNLAPNMNMYGPTGGAPAPRPAEMRPSQQLADQLGEGVYSSDDGGGMHLMGAQQPQVVGRTAELMAGLEADPKGANAGNFLQELVSVADNAVQREDWIEVVRVTASVIRAETAAGGPTGGGRHFNLTLKRIQPRRTLEESARLLVNPAVKDDVLIVMDRMGESATDVLLDLLVLAPVVAERRAYFDALVHTRRGSETVVRMLDHHEWFVVRNIAELCGELRLEAAIPGLALLLQNPEERVRKAAAIALAKIGTSATVEPLRQALKDPSPGVRVQTLVLIDGKHNRALALRIVAMLGEEETPQPPEVMREMCNALGRTATPEGVQALIRMANPPRKLLRKPPTAPRLMAVEGLKFAAPTSGVAKTALEQLKGDDDKEVAAAATKAVG